MAIAFSMTTIAVVGVILLIETMLLLSYISADRKIPSLRAIRTAYKKNKNLGYEHLDEGSGTLKVIEKDGMSNKVADRPGVQFFPNDIHSAERLDGQIPIIHYVEGWAYPVTSQSASLATDIKKKLKDRMVAPTYEAIHVLFKRDLRKPNDDVRNELITGSEERITDKELNQIREVKEELQNERVDTHKKPFMFNQMKEFVMLWGMNTNEALMKLQSYTIAVERGQIQEKKGFALDAKQIGPLLIAAAIAYLIYQSAGSGIMSSVGGIGP